MAEKLKMVPFQWRDLDGTENIFEIPESMHDAIRRAFGKMTLEVIGTTSQGFEERLQVIHPKMVDGDGWVCARCDQPYPCKEMRIIMMYDTDQPTEDKGIVIETKEGAITQQMKPSTTGTEQESDDDDE